MNTKSWVSVGAEAEDPTLGLQGQNTVTLHGGHYYQNQDIVCSPITLNT